VPLGDEEDVAIAAWNLDSPALRKIAAVAAFVPLLSIAEPALAAPPLSAPVTEPSTPPAAAVDPAVWEGLVDRQVLLTMKDGSTFRGTVLSMTNGALVCARSSDSLMMIVDPAQIQLVNVEGLPGHTQPKKPQTGQGLIVMGSIATAIGGALAIATLAVGAACIDSSQSYGGYSYACPYYTIPLGAVGLANLAVGIPFLATGLSKRKKFRAAAASAGEPTVSAFFAPGRNGVMAGVGVRF
jgi:hypothetical protein